MKRVSSKQANENNRNSTVKKSLKFEILKTIFEPVLPIPDANPYLINVGKTNMPEIKQPETKAKIPIIVFLKLILKKEKNE